MDHQTGRPGDLLVQVFIEVPKKFSDEQERLLRELAELDARSVYRIESHFSNCRPFLIPIHSRKKVVSEPMNKKVRREEIEAEKTEHEATDTALEIDADVGQATKQVAERETKRWSEHFRTTAAEADKRVLIAQAEAENLPKTDAA